MHRFFVRPDQIDDIKGQITGTDVNHIAHVLRLKPGEEILISNRQGTEYYCIIEGIEEESVFCRVLYTQAAEQELPTKLYLFQGLPKQDKMELIIQKSVELGAYEIIPVSMARTIVKITEKKLDKKTDRWQKISEAAAKQCGRGIIPKVHEPMSMKQAIEYAGTLDQVLVPYEKADDLEESKKIMMNPGQYHSIGIFIGPEGGIESQEIEKLEAIGARTVTLGKRILRTETAGLVALSILMYHLEV